MDSNVLTEPHNTAYWTPERVSEFNEMKAHSKAIDDTVSALTQEQVEHELSQLSSDWDEAKKRITHPVDRRSLLCDIWYLIK